MSESWDQARAGLHQELILLRGANAVRLSRRTALASDTELSIPPGAGAVHVHIGDNHIHHHHPKAETPLEKAKNAGTVLSLVDSATRAFRTILTG